MDETISLLRNLGTILTSLPPDTATKIHEDIPRRKSTSGQEATPQTE